MTYIRKGEGEVGRIWADLTEATTYAFLRGVVEYSTILGLDVEIQGEQWPVPDGQFHAIRVRVPGTDYSVRARNGYVAASGRGR